MQTTVPESFLGEELESFVIRDSKTINKNKSSTKNINISKSSLNIYKTKAPECFVNIHFHLIKSQHLVRNIIIYFGITMKSHISQYDHLRDRFLLNIFSFLDLKLRL